MSARAAIRPLLVALLLASAPTVGCASSAPAPTTIRDTARRAYYEGMRELVAGNYVRARQLFNQVARSPSYLSYSALARLRIGDALYLQDRFEEAVEVYRSFVAQYESDPNLPYARYRIAASYHARIPSEWFASPPAYEIDQTMTREAVRELRAFIKTFPTSRFADDARVKLDEARRMLFEHELYAADFYDARDKPRAVAWRLQVAVNEYPDMAVEPDLVWRMADAFAAAGDQADAAQALALYIERFPKGERHADAKRRLEAIRKQADQGAPKEGPKAPPKDDDKGSE